jgi:ribosomal-protein-alanine N-acetyltransferase
MLEVRTPRLTLLACPANVARAAHRGRLHLEALLGTKVHEDWPTPEIRGFLPIYARQIESAPGLLGWGIWLIIHESDQQVIGDVGFKGRPDHNGTVDIGYGVVPAYRQQGYAFEAAAGLRDWAFQQPGVRRMTGDCWPHNTASARILAKLGMTQIGLSESGLLLWELRREQHHPPR